ncbi:ComF family protein [Lactobacillus salsicarnum]|uniref:ComF family protein n=2 Tax=Companilactobacillus mishanensis TaxID=2486008 RepID=A0ABW9P8N9_9LACO|nr:ComF family protein [Companilactobacillus mishanensis]
MICLNCGQQITRNLSVSEILTFSQISDRSICDFCNRQLVKLSEFEVCSRCSKITTLKICNDCTDWEENHKIINQHFAIYGYNQFMHDYFKKYKRYGDVLMADLFSHEIRHWALRHKFDLVTYIPSSPSHFDDRGFDPVYELYQDIFSLESVFLKQDADRPQAQKNKLERLNTPQTFQLKVDFRKKDKNMKMLILDDIYTTGRTLLHARAVLEMAGFQNIYTFSLSR